MRASLAGLALAAAVALTSSPAAVAHVHSSGCRLDNEQHFAKRQAPAAPAAAAAPGTVSGEGQISAASGGAAAANYRCDPNTCKLPNCNCASTRPPGGLDPKDVPQFILFTADDAVQTYTIDATKQFLAQRKNPNGCPVPMTYFTSLNYTNYQLVTEWYVAGNEIADHTMTHVGTPPEAEVRGNLIALHALAGIPYKSITGFRAPYLNYSRETLEMLAKFKFDYDSSSTASVPVTDPNTDAFWPYTLDNGMANDCQAVDNICSGQPKLPGFWEIPMYAIFGDKGAADPHLMDPWLDSTDASAVLRWMQNTFLDHYNGNRQPFGLYSHPIHVATNYPGLTTPKNMITAINQFLDWATTNSSMQNVWMISNEQLIAYMRNPVPASQLNTLDAFKCSTPNLGSQKICNGMPANQGDLPLHCISDTRGDALNDSPFYTCYGCPVTTPSPQQPDPPQKNKDGSLRTRIGDNCDTPWWDPIAGKCLCSDASCAFTDATRPIGPNGANLTASPTTNADGNGDSGAPVDPYSNFNQAPIVGASSAASVLLAIAAAVAIALFT